MADKSKDQTSNKEPVAETSPFTHIHASELKNGDVLSSSSPDGSLRTWGTVSEVAYDKDGGVVVATLKPHAGSRQKHPFSERFRAEDELAVYRKV